MSIGFVRASSFPRYLSKLSGIYLRSIAIVFTLFFPTLVFAINSDQWQIEHIQIEDGLPDSTIYSMAQDHTGFMWFGTTRGLARFDGYTFKTLKHDVTNPDTISNNNAGNIFIDSKNQLWIGTFGGGANKLDLNSNMLTRYPYAVSQVETMISANVQTFYEDHNGAIWIGTATGLYQYVDEEIKHFDPHHGKGEVEHSRVWDIVGNDQGDLWIGTSNGLYLFDQESEEFTQYQLPPEMVIDITSNQFRTLLMKDDTLWVGSSSGLFSFNINQKSFQFHSPSQRSIKINDIYQAPNNSLLIASMEGLYMFDLEKNTFKLGDNGDYWQPLSYVDVRNISIDKSGILWLATRDNGLYKIDLAGGLFQHHTKYLPESELNEKAKQVWTLESVDSDFVYMGTSETLFKMDKGEKSERVVTKGMDLIPGIVRDIETEDESGLWVASSKGLYFVPVGTTTAEMITVPFDLVGIVPADVFSVEITNSGEIWLALYNLGVLRWNPTENKAELLQGHDGENLTDLNITLVFQDSKNNIWIGSNLIGLYKFDLAQNKIRLYNHDYNRSDSISSNRIKDVFEDSKKRLWVATARGLNQYSSELDAFIRFTYDESLVNNTINFVLEDSQHNLWLGFKFGLSRFNPERAEINNYLLNAAIKHDGLITRAATIDDEDIIYLGSANGFYTFNPKEHKNLNRYLPPLTLTSVKVDNVPLQKIDLEYKEKQFNLDHKEQLISFDFSVLDFKTPEQIQYFYRINGLHDDWLNVTNTRRVDLQELNPGEYKLAIRATNNDGRWHEQSKLLDVVVKPVWWERHWVRASILSMLLLLATTFHYYRTYKIRKQNLLLETEVNKRTTELQRLNEQLKMAVNLDYLTGLPNRMSFISEYEKKQKKDVNMTLDSCIVLADIDQFKKVNDQYGHSAGDQILVKLSQIMKELISNDDLVARWGGEEFIFYFHNKNIDVIIALIEHIRETIESTQISYKNQSIPVTMTFGVCPRLADMGLIDCINAADKSMYQGKSMGRNVVVLSEVT